MKGLIDIKQIRIGDYLFHENDNSIVVVEGITTTSILVNDKWCNIDQFSFININMELFKKLGNGTLDFNSGGPCIKVPNTKTGSLYFLGGRGEYISMHDKGHEKIFTLHEFQHKLYDYYKIEISI